MAPYFIAFALPYHLLPESRAKCGLWSALSYGLFTALFTAVTNSEPGLVWPILLGLGAVLCKDRVGEKQGLLLLPVMTLALGGLLGAAHGYYENALLWLLGKLGSSTTVSGVVFGVLNTLLRPLSGAFEQPVYLHSAGGTVWLNGQILTGAKNIFAAKPDRLATALFLSGKGLQLFLLPGFALTLADCGKTRSKAALALFTVGVCTQRPYGTFYLIFGAGKSVFAAGLCRTHRRMLFGVCAAQSPLGIFAEWGNRGVSPAQQQRRTALSCGRDILRAGLFCQPVHRGTLRHCGTQLRLAAERSAPTGTGTGWSTKHSCH